MEFIFDNERPIYIQLVEQLKVLIVNGKLQPNEKIPSVRELALKLQVNPNTIQKALMELENEKLIYTERTNGKFVTSDIDLIKKSKDNLAKKTADIFLMNMEKIGFSDLEAISYLQRKEKNNGIDKM